MDPRQPRLRGSAHSCRGGCPARRGCGPYIRGRPCTGARGRTRSGGRDARPGELLVSTFAGAFASLRTPDAVHLGPPAATEPPAPSGTGPDRCPVSPGPPSSDAGTHPTGAATACPRHVPCRRRPRLPDRPDSADLPLTASRLMIRQGRSITDLSASPGTDRHAGDDRFQPPTALDGDWALCESLDRSGPIVFIGRGPEQPDVPGGSGTSGGPDHSRPSAGPRGRTGCTVARISPNQVA